MPIYEYLCQKCEGKFEVIQKFSDEPLTEHAGCGGSVERLVSAPAFQFTIWPSGSSIKIA